MPNSSPSARLVHHLRSRQPNDGLLGALSAYDAGLMHEAADTIEALSTHIQALEEGLRDALTETAEFYPFDPPWAERARSLLTDKEGEKP